MITIIDYGGSNLASIIYSLNRLGFSAHVSQDAKTIRRSSHIILPGVTTAETAMQNLVDLSLIDVIRTLTQPVLGICLGLQILFDHSEEGDVPCLQIIPGKVKALCSGENVTVPHMGWNAIKKTNDEFIMRNIPDLSYVYYVHSFAATIGLYTSSTTDYGNIFSASVQYRNFFGTQFHPERSGVVGSHILKNFLEL